MKFATAAIAELGRGLQQPSLATVWFLETADIVDLIVPFEIPVTARVLPSQSSSKATSTS